MSRKAHLAATLLRPLWKLRPKQRRGQRVLTYHAIGSRVPDDTLNLHSISPDRFAAQMDVLARSGLRVGALGEEHTDIAISFDDGYRDTLSVAHPILARHGFAFTVFVAVGFLRSRNDALYLNDDDIHALKDADVFASFGAHGVSHQRLTVLDDQALRDELHESRGVLSELLGDRVDRMSYPHGAVDARVRAAVAQAGFTRAWTSQFGLNDTMHSASNPLMLHRMAIWSTDDDRVFAQKLRGEWDWMGLYKRPR